MSAKLRLLLGVLLVVAALVAMLATGPRVWRMCRVRGWLPGTAIVAEKVTGLRVDRSMKLSRWGNSESTSYVVSWSPPGDLNPSANEAALDHDAWSKLRAGDSIDVVRIPGDARPYLRIGSFASTVNVLLHSILLALELAVAAYCATRLFRALRRVPQ